MLYLGFNTLPRSVFWSADLNGRSDNTDVIPICSKAHERSIPTSVEIVRAPYEYSESDRPTSDDSVLAVRLDDICNFLLFDLDNRRATPLDCTRTTSRTCCFVVRSARISLVLFEKDPAHDCDAGFLLGNFYGRYHCVLSSCSPWPAAIATGVFPSGTAIGITMC